MDAPRSIIPVAEAEARVAQLRLRADAATGSSERKELMYELERILDFVADQDGERAMTTASDSRFAEN